MLAKLKLHQAGLGFTQEVGMFLGRCDLVKFAKVEPDADEVDLLFAKAQDLVQFSGPDEARGLTAPKPAGELAPAPAPAVPTTPVPRKSTPADRGPSMVPEMPSAAIVARSKSSSNRSRVKSAMGIVSHRSS